MTYIEGWVSGEELKTLKKLNRDNKINSFAVLNSESVNSSDYHEVGFLITENPSKILRMIK